MADKIEQALEQKIIEEVGKALPAVLSELVPQESWQESIKQATEAFFKKSDQYIQQARISRFDHVIYMALENETRKQLVVYFDSPEWQGQWRPIDMTVRGENGQLNPLPGFTHIACDEVRKCVAANIEKIIETMVGGQIQAAVDSMKWQVKSSLEKNPQ